MGEPLAICEWLKGGRDSSRGDCIAIVGDEALEIGVVARFLSGWIAEETGGDCHLRSEAHLATSHGPEESSLATNSPAASRGSGTVSR